MLNVSNFKFSIASQLLKAIFGIYIFVAFVVTGIQLFLEFSHEKKAIINLIAETQSSFAPALSDAIWEYNEEVIDSLMKGIRRNPLVLGVILKDDFGNVLKEIGRTGAKEKDKETKGGAGSGGFSDELFNIDFKIEHITKGGKKGTIGTISLYSGNEIVIQQIIFGFKLIIINSFIKTTILWLIMIYYVRKILAKPITGLTNKIRSFDFENLQHISWKLPKKNELSILKDSFNTMVDRLVDVKGRIEIYQDELEKKIVERTLDLKLAKQQSVELKEAKEKVEQAAKMKEVFLMNMGHEIRTPMNAILGFTEILKSRISEPDLLEYLNSIASSGNSLIAIIQDILELSKDSEGDEGELYENINIRTIVNEVASAFIGEINKKGITLSLFCEGEVPNLVKICSLRVKQILTCLVDNAVKFTDEGMIEIKIKGLVNDSNKKILSELSISVKDTGIGIDKNKLGKIFDVFYKVHGEETSIYGGIGMGLTICEKLVKKFNGNIIVNSDLDYGSVFTMVFPDVEIIESDEQDAVSLETFTTKLETEKTESESFFEVGDVAISSKLKEKIRALHTEWEEVVSSQTIQDVDSFAKKAKKIGETFEWPSLVKWSTKLHRETEMFMIDEMGVTLKKFPEFMAKVNDVKEEDKAS